MRDQKLNSGVENPASASRGISIERLCDLPKEWSRQFEVLGLSPKIASAGSRFRIAAMQNPELDFNRRLDRPLSASCHSAWGPNADRRPK